MLVLTRKLGEEIVIDGDIRITVVEAANGRVKLGIVAPKSVRVDRAEVHELRERADEPLPPATQQNRLPAEHREPVARPEPVPPAGATPPAAAPALPNRLATAVAHRPFKRKPR